MNETFEPTKIVFIGPHDQCKEALNYGRDLLKTVRRLMAFQQLPQYNLVRIAPNGCTIEAWSGYGLSQIVITAVPPVPPPKFKKELCFCNACVALGVVTGIVDTTILTGTAAVYESCLDNIEEYPPKDQFYCGQNILYNLAVCAKTYYISYENIKALDHTPYCVNDKVLVIPLEDSTLIAIQTETYCYAACSSGCFTSAASPVINVGIIPIDASVLPLRYTEDGL